MKLLLDENLSRRLLPLLHSAFPNSAHVVEKELLRSSDLDIWNFAKANGFAIATKDDDFISLAQRHGAPPIVIRLEFGNASNETTAQRLISIAPEIDRIADASGTAVIRLF